MEQLYFTEEHKMFRQTAIEFGENRILPNREALNVLNKELSLEIFKEMGELGFLGIDIPEEYGGLNLDKTTSGIVVDYLAYSECASILVTLGAHSGIGTLPIVWFGNDNQKKKYLSYLEFLSYQLLLMLSRLIFIVLKILNLILPMSTKMIVSTIT